MIPPVRALLSSSWDPEIRLASKTAGQMSQGGSARTSGEGIIGTMVEESGGYTAELIAGDGGGGDGGGGDGGGGDGGGDGGGGDGGGGDGGGDG